MLGLMRGRSVGQPGLQPVPGTTMCLRLMPHASSASSLQLLALTDQGLNCWQVSLHCQTKLILLMQQSQSCLMHDMPQNYPISRKCNNVDTRG